MNNVKKHFSVATNVDSTKKFEDLFLFGYQSTIFNDDEKALYIDQGKHLIPWMGDETLLIDRYDGRGHLSDLTSFDADLAKGRWQPLNDREKQIEIMLDEERYYELNNDIHEKMLYEEEELKRLSEALADNSYAAVAFNYYDDQQADQEPISMEKSENVEEEEGEEDTFVMPSNLNISLDIPIPTSMRQYSIIERTAMFVSKQGSQMEIVIKTKQKDNPSFQFLDFTNPLYLFYKHLVELIKSGKFKPTPKVIKEGHSNQAEMIHDSHKEDQISSTDFLQSIQDKLPVGQIVNTPYAKLLSNLVKLAPTAIATKSVGNTTSDNAVDVTAAYSSEDETQTTGIDIPPPPPPPPPSDEQQESMDEEDFICKNSPNDDIIQASEIVPPPPDQQPIIDKMAEYVIRNGPEFEELVKMKKDKRFAFVEEDHQFRNYYVYKKQMFSQKKMNDEIKNSEKSDNNKELEDKNREASINHVKSKKLVDYEYNESSSLLVTYNSDSDESYYENENDIINSNKRVDNKISESIDFNSANKKSKAGLVSYGSQSEYSDNDKINFPKNLVKYDEFDDDNSNQQFNDSKKKDLTKSISLVPSYLLYSDDEVSHKNIKKRKRRKKSRPKVYGPMLPGDFEEKISKMVFKPNVGEQFGPQVDIQVIKSPRENASTEESIIQNPAINPEYVCLPNNIEITENINSINKEILIENSFKTSYNQNILDQKTFIFDNINPFEHSETVSNISEINKYDSQDNINKNFYGPVMPEYLNLEPNICNQNEIVKNEKINKKSKSKKKKILGPELPEFHKSKEQNINDEGFDPKLSPAKNPLNSDSENILNFKNEGNICKDFIEHKQQKENRKTKRRKIFGHHFRKPDDSSINSINNSPITYSNDCATNMDTATSDNNSNYKISEMNPFDLNTHLILKTTETNLILESNEEDNQIHNQSVKANLDLFVQSPLNVPLNNDRDKDSFDHSEKIVNDVRFQSTSYYDENALSDDESMVQSSDTLDSDSENEEISDNNTNCTNAISNIDFKNKLITKNKEESQSGDETSEENNLRKKNKHAESDERHKTLKSISFMIKAKPREDDTPKVLKNVFKNILSSEEEIDENLINEEDTEYPMEASLKNQWHIVPKEKEIFLNNSNFSDNQQWVVKEKVGSYTDTTNDIWGGDEWVSSNTLYNLDSREKQQDWGRYQKFEEQNKDVGSQKVTDYCEPVSFDPFRMELMAMAKEQVEIQKDMAVKFINKLQQMDGLNKKDNNSPLTNPFQNKFETISNFEALDSSSIALHLPQCSLSQDLSSTSTSSPKPSTHHIKSTVRSISPMTLLSEARISPLVVNSKERSRSSSKSPQPHKRKTGKKSHKKKKKHKKESSSKHSQKYSDSPKPQLKRYMREEDIEERMRVLNEAIKRKILQEEHEKRKRKRKREKKKKAMMEYESSGSEDVEIFDKKPKKQIKEIMVDLTLLSNSDDGSSSDVIIQEIIEP